MTPARWRTSLVNHWARAVGYDFAWKFIEAAQEKEEGKSAEAAEAAEAEAAKAPSAEVAAAILAAADARAAERSAHAWRSLVQTLMMSLHDGYTIDASLPTISVQKLFYPQWWLEKVGYYGPKYYPCYGPCATAVAQNSLALGQTAAANAAVANGLRGTRLAVGTGGELGMGGAAGGALMGAALELPDDRLRVPTTHASDVMIPPS